MVEKQELTNGAELHELTAAEIFETDDSRVERVEVPEWGGYVFIRGLTGEERDAFENSIIEGRGRNREINLRNFRAKLVVAAAVNSKGQQLFSDSSHVMRLGKKSARALERLFEKAQELAGLREEDINEMTKELGKGQNGDSGSVSPLLSGSQ